MSASRFSPIRIFIIKMQVFKRVLEFWTCSVSYGGLLKGPRPLILLNKPNFSNLVLLNDFKSTKCDPNGAKTAIFCQRNPKNCQAACLWQLGVHRNKTFF